MESAVVCAPWSCHLIKTRKRNMPTPAFVPILWSQLYAEDVDDTSSPCLFVVVVVVKRVVLSARLEGCVMVLRHGAGHSIHRPLAIFLLHYRTI